MLQWSQPMQSSADIALQPTDKKANFCRLTQLLICGGVTLLRETFDSIYPPATLPGKLGDPATKSHLQRLRDLKKVLTQLEWNQLYPSPGMYGKSTDFDITLFFKLFRNICNLTPPCTGWDKLPISTNLSLEADLVRIKYYRNEVHAHSKTMELSDSEFEVLWRNISATLLRIAGSLSSAKKDEWQESIDKFRCNPSTPDAQRYLAELQLWYKKDMDTKEEVEKLRSEIEKLNSKKEPSINIQITAESPQLGRRSAISPVHLPRSSAGQFHKASQPSGYIHVSIPIPLEQPQFGTMGPTSSGDFQTKQPHSPDESTIMPSGESGTPRQLSGQDTGENNNATAGGKYEVHMENFHGEMVVGDHNKMNVSVVSDSSTDATPQHQSPPTTTPATAAAPHEPTGENNNATAGGKYEVHMENFHGEMVVGDHNKMNVSVVSDSSTDAAPQHQSPSTTAPETVAPPRPTGATQNQIPPSTSAAAGTTEPTAVPPHPKYLIDCKDARGTVMIGENNTLNVRS